MVYQALYRTYRPRHFSEVIDQDHIVRTLQNSVRQGKVGHAYLFSGPRGTGKTTIARILARAINCEGPVDGEPCDKCDRCKGTDEGLGVLEIDAASHGSVDDMRQLVAQVSQVPLAGGMMVYIIDEVHMLSKEAFNAFLKTLEEPPPHAVFVLATTEPGKLLPTIHSRCQHFSFRRLPLGLIAEHIAWICKQEKVPAEDTAIRLIARAGDGSARDSISVLEQAIAFEPDGLTLDGVRQVLGIPDRVEIRKLGGYVGSGDPGKVSSAFVALIESGREPGSILSELLSHFRDLLFTSLGIDHADLKLLPEEEWNEIKGQSGRLSADDIHRAIAFLAKCEGEIRWDEDPALLLEVSLLRLAARFVEGKRPARTRSSEEPEEETETGDEVAMFPAAEEKPPAAPPRREPEPRPDRPSLTGGLTLKAEPEGELEIPKSVRERARARKKKPKRGAKELLRSPEGIGAFWLDALESVRETSLAEYILLAEAVPSPPPSEWPEEEDEKKKPLELVLRYPSDRGLLVRLLNEKALFDRVSSRLEEVLERPISLSVVYERGDEPEANEGTKASQEGMIDGEGPVSGGPEPSTPSLFQGAGRPAPKDPDLRQIHNLVVEDFPEYRIEYDGPAG